VSLAFWQKATPSIFIDCLLHYQLSFSLVEEHQQRLKTSKSVICAPATGSQIQDTH
jgi:FMN-dependent NADH-azoreductase